MNIQFHPTPVEGQASDSGEVTGYVKSYTLQIADWMDNGHRASMERVGPDQIVIVAEGRPTAIVGQMAAMLHPICPNAHAVAALRAAEKAMEHFVPDEAEKGREIAITVERVVSSLWRLALVWPKIAGLDEMPGPLAAAMGLQRSIMQDIFPADWRYLGGRKPEAIKDSTLLVVDSLSGTASELFDSAAEIIQSAPDIDIPKSHQAMALGDDITNHSFQPSTHARFESQVSDRPTSVKQLLEDQLAGTKALVATLKDALTNPSLPADQDRGFKLDGIGFGFALTARGRLRHQIAVDKDLIRNWRVDAPTDWNFAPGGPVEIAVQQIPFDDLGWLVMAFDPCMPCTIQKVLENA